MQLTRLLTKQLTGFWLLTLSAVAGVMLLSSFLAFIHFTQSFQQQQLSNLQQTIFTQYHSEGQLHDTPWLTDFLQGLQVKELQVFDGSQRIFHYLPELNLADQDIKQYRQQQGDIVLIISLDDPNMLSLLDGPEYTVLAVCVLLVILLVGSGYYWLRQQLQGIESLARRSAMILRNDLTQAELYRDRARPLVVNRALSRLLAKLQDASRERARFDTFIRSNTFLDPQTGVGNPMFFASRLEALSLDQKMILPGVLFVLELEELDWLQQNHGDAVVVPLLVNLCEAISGLINSLPNSIVARRSDNQLAIIVPQISLAEAEGLAKKVIKICLAQPLPQMEEPDNFFHLGLAYFREGDNQQQLLEEVGMALKAAQLQGNSSWFMYDKGAIDEEFSRGSVRWRSILENALEKRQIKVFCQQVQAADKQVLHAEVFTRVIDHHGSLIRATLFMPMAQKCGLMPMIERQAIEIVAGNLENERRGKPTYSLNLSVDSLLSKTFIHWFKSFLLEHRNITGQLIFEVSEEILVKHGTVLAPTLAMIKAMGCKLCVDHVGLQVQDSEYIHELNVDIIKLHRSVIRQLNQRPENQLFIRSLMGGVFRTDVKLLAEGVETFEEWQTLIILGVDGGQGGFIGEPLAL
ncbi:RNase E specificity factor CsrD [Shewanella sp. NIFS-20-20]|uniref:RNase E specificity factor CsrD n=1 Tax=Shewanella sp. NIFS-20-20 TaxID=2853806 RepID=UPI001C43E3FE|nr:RNase E specificity factor CsrD [Shewanella sp. NIFS-20-20]MBV7316822.1 RNase E specificity factor CsrD [Shewanella sp. NIFS-20-20]